MEFKFDFYIQKAEYKKKKTKTKIENQKRPTKIRDQIASQNLLLKVICSEPLPLSYIHTYIHT